MMARCRQIPQVFYNLICTVECWSTCNLTIATCLDCERWLNACAEILAKSFNKSIYFTYFVETKVVSTAFAIP